MPKLWVLKAKGNASSFGGNDGYNDVPDSHYVYDTTVKNHDKISVGDVVVVVDKLYVLGFARIEEIDLRRDQPKIRYRCPICNTQEHYSRKGKTPRHKCRNKHEFDTLVEEHIKVEQFIARYGKSFRIAQKSTVVSSLNPYYIKRNIYYSIQPAHPEFLKLFAESRWLLSEDVQEPDPFKTSEPPEEPYEPTNEDERLRSSVKQPTRKGQQRFRNKLIRIYGCRCMITGIEVPEAIEASHICPYRGAKDNHPANGLLLRKDLHALFDANLLGFDPESTQLKLDPKLMETTYAKYNGLSLSFKQAGSMPSKAALKVRWTLFQA